MEPKPSVSAHVAADNGCLREEGVGSELFQEAQCSGTATDGFVQRQIHRLNM